MDRNGSMVLRLCYDLVDIDRKAQIANDIIAHAAVDVVSKEPMEKDNVLLKAKNIIITPHIAWAPIEARTRLIKIVSKNLQKWVAGTPINVIE